MSRSGSTEVWDRIKANISDIDTPEKFEKRLEITTLLYSYVEKEYERKFPDEYAEYLKKGEKL